MPACAIDDAGVEQRADGQVGCRGIAAGIGDQAGGGDALAAEFRQSISGFGQQFGLRVGLFVPGGVGGGRAQTKSAAQIDDFGAGREEGRRELHGNFRRGGQENDGDAFGAHGFRRAGGMAWAG